MRVYFAPTPEEVLAGKFYTPYAYMVSTWLINFFSLGEEGPLRGEALEEAEEMALFQASLVSLARGNSTRPCRVVVAADIPKNAGTFICADDPWDPDAIEAVPEIYRIPGVTEVTCEPEEIKLVSFHVDEAGSEFTLNGWLQSGELTDADFPQLLWFDASEEELVKSYLADRETVEP